MTYCLPEDYQINPAPRLWDDTAMRDEWQREVYLMAYAIALITGAKTILDVGCGSGFKTLRYLRGFGTMVGVEIEPTLSFLRETYPDEHWLAPEEVTGMFDLVVCADVIEHVHDPDELCRFIRKHAKDHIVISTPDRTRDPESAMGPPSNDGHVREWAFDEFSNYIRSQFHLRGQIVTNEAQTTYAAICGVRFL